MPIEGSEVKILSAPELCAHATAMPWLRYITDESLPGVVIGRSAMVSVNLPRPERLAWHKMLVSQIRYETSDKAPKDLEQAATPRSRRCHEERERRRDKARGASSRG